MKEHKESLDDLIKEHNRLVKVLKSGSKEDQLKEARIQNKELSKYKRERGVKNG